MSDWLTALGPAASVAASTLISALWEGAALAALAWIALRAFPRLSAAARSTVWLGVFALLIGLQVLPGRRTPDAPMTYGRHLHLDVRWSLAIVGLWFFFSLWRSVQLGASVAHLWRLAGRAVELPAIAGFDEMVAGRRVRLCASDEIARPSVIGFFQPRILIPVKLLESLPEEELKQVLIHEMEHLRRADDWTNLLQKLALVAFPLNPALAWVERRLCAERELACDDRVLESGSGRKAYALCLAHLAEHAMWQRGMSLALGAWERRPELVRRVERILSAGERTLGRRLAMGLTGGVMAASLAGALALSRSPEVVSFAPVPQAELASSEMPKLVGARPQLMRAAMVSTRTAAVVPAHPRGRKKPQGWRTEHLRPKAVEPQVRLAGLRKPLENAPGGEALLVMTEWNDLGVQQRVIWAALRDTKEPDVKEVPAIYLVATPNGWVIVQI